MIGQCLHDSEVGVTCWYAYIRLVRREFNNGKTGY